MEKVGRRAALKHIGRTSFAAGLSLLLAGCATPMSEPTPLPPKPFIQQTPLVLAPQVEPTPTLPEVQLPTDIQIQTKVGEIMQTVKGENLDDLILKSVYLGNTDPRLSARIPSIFSLPTPTGYNTDQSFAQFNFGLIEEGTVQVLLALQGQEWTYHTTKRFTPQIAFSKEWYEAPEDVQKLVMAKEAITPFLWGSFREFATLSFLNQGGKVYPGSSTHPSQDEIKDVITRSTLSSPAAQLGFDYAGYVAIFPWVEPVSAEGKKYLSAHTDLMLAYEFVKQNNMATQSPAFILDKKTNSFVMNPDFNLIAFGNGPWAQKIQELAQNGKML